MSRLTHKVQELVVDNKVEEALDCMIKFFREKDLERFKSCIELKRQYNMFESENSLNTIDDSVFNLNINRIGTAVIDIVMEIDDGRWADATEVEEETGKKTNSFKNAIQVDRLTKRDWMLGGLGSLSLIVFFIWMFKPPQQNLIQKHEPTIVSEKTIPNDTKPNITKSVGDMYEEARISRNNDKFDEAIKICHSILIIDKCHWKSLNLIAECYINIHTQKSKDDDHSPELIKARDNAYNAMKCNGNDEGGYINSTLAQIFGLEENDKKFFYYTEKALQKGLRIWEFDYANEPGFSNYAKNSHFLQLLKDYRNPTL